MADTKNVDFGVVDTTKTDDGFVTSAQPINAGNNQTPLDGSSVSESELVSQGLRALESRNRRWYSYLTTADFWIVLAIGQVLALCITGTNTFSTFLVNEGTSIPAFQTLFNYILMLLIYTPISMYQNGIKAYGKMLWTEGWKMIIFAFLDVEGNYFTVLAYRYTNILSAQLINFWSIVCVVIISFTLLRVRYKIPQIIGILVCCGGMGLLIASDHITGSNGGPGEDIVKGDLFALLGATLYGVSNVFEEFLVSKRPIYDFLSLLGIFGSIILGVQAAIFDRQSFDDATWNGKVAGYLVGFTLLLNLFYALVPLMLRMASAAFFDVALLTGNFWGVIIGIHVFGLTVHFLYPIAFVLIVLGLVTYFLAGSMLGDAKKPWLGEHQEGGIAGIGTAKLKAIKEAERRRAAGITGDEV